MSGEKVSTLTIRLTAEEAAQLETLKALTGKTTGSEALKYVMREYPRERYSSRNGRNNGWSKNGSCSGYNGRCGTIRRHCGS